MTKIQVGEMIDNNDGYVFVEFFMDNNAFNSFAKKGLKDSIMEAVNRIDNEHVSDQPEINPCDVINDEVMCEKCNCWKIN